VVAVKKRNLSYHLTRRQSWCRARTGRRPPVCYSSTVRYTRVLPNSPRRGRKSSILDRPDKDLRPGATQRNAQPCHTASQWHQHSISSHSFSVHLPSSPSSIHFPNQLNQPQPHTQHHNEKREGEKKGTTREINKYK